MWAYVRAGQALHAVAASTAAYRPGGHAIHAATPGDGAIVPTPQGVQEDALEALENRPGGHGAPLLVAAAGPQKEPGAEVQTPEQLNVLVPPAVVEKVPAGHAVHVGDPGPLKRPGGHSPEHADVHNPEAEPF